jgi:transposase-like protein
MAINQKYLTARQLAERYGKTPETIRVWYRSGKGPRGEKVGTTILYPLDEVIAWEEEQRRQNSECACANA